MWNPKPPGSGNATPATPEPVRPAAPTSTPLYEQPATRTATPAAAAAQGEQAFPGKGNPPAGDEELRRLRAENHQLRMERDILKKLGWQSRLDQGLLNRLEVCRRVAAKAASQRPRRLPSSQQSSE